MKENEGKRRNDRAKNKKKEIDFFPLSRKCRWYIIIRGTYVYLNVRPRLRGRVGRLYIRIDRLYNLRINP